MSKFIRKYWIEIIVFTLIFGVLLKDLLPNLTWINTDSDGAHYTLAAKYMYPSHDTSAPLFLLLGRLFLFIPFGTEAWRLGLISVFATTGASIFVYLIVKRLVQGKNARLLALISAIIYGGSALVISQSTIIETYALSTCLMVIAYYFSLKRNWIGTSAVIGLLLAIHTLFAIIIWFVLLAKYKQLRDVTLVVITLSGLLFYLYIPIVTAVNHPPQMWGNTNLGGFFNVNWEVMRLIGSLSVYDFPKRLLDTLGILGISLGLGAFVILWYFIKQRTYKGTLLWLVMIPIIYFVINLSPETYVYLLPSIAFGAIAVGMGLSKLNIKWACAIMAVAVILWGFNANYLDIGKNLDPNLSATEFYTKELPKLKDGDILLTGNWTWAISYLYNKEEGRNIIAVSTDDLLSKEYLNKLEANGIKFERSNSKSQIDRQWEVALSIAENNPNVWIAKETIPSQYNYELVLAKGNEEWLTRWLGYKTQVEWKWKPSNPYLFITGALEVEQWKFILISTRNCLFVIEWGGGALFIYYLILKYIDKGNKKKAKDVTFK